MPLNLKWCGNVNWSYLSILRYLYQRDLEAGLITEFEAQEMIDHLIMKLRMVKFARTPE